ncbi:MAG: hypothetical protein QW790_02895 [Candidatus Aenigmatarchaeota archaeon]
MYVEDSYFVSFPRELGNGNRFGTIFLLRRYEKVGAISFMTSSI